MGVKLCSGREWGVGCMVQGICGAKKGLWPYAKS